MTAILVERIADTSIGGVGATSHYRAGHRRPSRPVTACQVALARPITASALGLWRRAARAGFGIIYLGGLAVLIWTVVGSFAPVYQVVTLG
ncbi:MAG: hypothetical protein FWF36_05055 [Propionibacteriaceae bacterium]|nr:hypothetical protein [Propionibacteriaceae bacterium]